MATHAEHVLDQAIAWHLGLEEAGAEAWRDFVAWLEADPAHQDAYDRLTLDDGELAAPLEPASPPAACPRRIWPRRVAWGGTALAAAAAAWLALLPGTLPARDIYSIETAPGARRVVALADGTKIAMNGATRVTLDRADPRTAVLERGEAMFEVAHHADRPFEVRSGDVVLRDVGTRFNVTRRGAALDVAVAEGSVLYQPDREAVSLTRGMALASRDGDDHLALRHVAAETVGGWREGHLDFRDVPLDTVAEAIGRSTGAIIRVADPMKARAFTGTLRIDRAPGEIASSLAALAGGSSRRDGPGWLIAPTSTGAH